MVVRVVPRYQICPACGYAEEQSKRWDRRRQIYKVFWHNEQCPNCSGPLVRACPQCGADLSDPSHGACPQCGNAYPWRDRVASS